MATDDTRKTIVDTAVARYMSDNADEANDGLFTTAHFARAMKIVLRIEGRVPDGETCRDNLLAMDDVEQVEPCLWRRLISAGASA